MEQWMTELDYKVMVYEEMIEHQEEFLQWIHEHQQNCAELLEKHLEISFMPDMDC